MCLLLRKKETCDFTYTNLVKLMKVLSSWSGLVNIGIEYFSGISYDFTKQNVL